MKSITVSQIEKVMGILSDNYSSWKSPVISFMTSSEGTPFRVLISTILSQRTKDEVTSKAVEKLFNAAPTIGEMSRLSLQSLEKLIYPAGFYKTKALRILEICGLLINNYESRVPGELDELLKLPGVGRKTANLVLIRGFNKDGICVDTHVHRISNRLGFVKTKTPDKTEFALRDKLPLHLWRKYNEILVAFGQVICRPISPLCSICPVNKICLRIGVVKSR